MPGWLKALAKTRKQLGSAVRDWIGGRSESDALSLDDLEEHLIRADLPFELVEEILEELGTNRNGNCLARLREMLINRMASSGEFSWDPDRLPEIILIVGVNGSGKTTTCAKLAALARGAGRSPLLVAADTFRAAGADQLRIWADRLECPVVSGQTGGDGASVVYDGLEAASARSCDAVIIDTAGRMHTRKPLMEELEKIKDTIAKKVEGAPHHVWMVLDASNGRNAVLQARSFHEATPLTGVIVAKLDGSSKAGFLFSVQEELGVPIMYAGLGEGVDDLTLFKNEEFVNALLPIDDEEG